MKRRLIGVMLSDATAEYPRNVLKGIMEQAKVLDYNVAVFSSFIRSEGSERHQVGDMKIFQLPNYNMLDGVIILPDSIHLKDTLEKIKVDLSKNCSCPVICADMTDGNWIKIPTNEEKDFMEIVEHFITEHKFTKINCLTGVKGSVQAELRLEGYKKALVKYNIEIDDTRIMYGDFWKDSGKLFVEKMMLDKENLPEAIVCANDYMAIAVCEALKEYGYRVPEDICVSGFDNIREAVLNHPSIATIRSPQKEIGMRAVRFIHKYYEGKVQDSSILYGELLVGESCGCNKISYYSKESLIQRKNFQAVINNMRSEISELNLMRETLVGVDSMEEFFQRLNEKVYLIKGYKDFYLCLNDDWNDNSGDVTTSYINENWTSKNYYTDRMNVQVLHKNKLFVSNNTSFKTSDMLSALWEETENMNTYFFVPVHFEARTYGYAVVTYEDKSKIYDYDLRSWISNISTCLEIQRIQNNLRWYHDQVENLAIRDTLTGVYNRRGLDKYSKHIFLEAIEYKKYFSMFVVDLDNLKWINDNHGHQEGDNALLMVTETFLRLPSELGVFARTGGDEFVYIFSHEMNKESIIEFKRKIQNNLRDISLENSNGYMVSISIGIYYGIPSSTMDISDCHSIADKSMYYEKVRKKGFV